jgi:hypothetical protein
MFWSGSLSSANFENCGQILVPHTLLDGDDAVARQDGSLRGGELNGAEVQPLVAMDAEVRFAIVELDAFPVYGELAHARVDHEGVDEAAV